MARSDLLVIEAVTLSHFTVFRRRSSAKDEVCPHCEGGAVDCGSCDGSLGYSRPTPPGSSAEPSPGMSRDTSKGEFVDIYNMKRRPKNFLIFAAFPYEQHNITRNYRKTGVNGV